ncbi:VWA domain-containing protein [Mycobacterium sp. NBC_00419]|uniref:vWA domain-containing protein n=1 Tax=Mycobacterium sp. NBC_00419 TaxID=2975989 RepID=UPI002E1AD52A
MSMRFNVPPNWPVPPGWSPGPGRRVDPSWPAPPAGWQFWIVEDDGPPAFPGPVAGVEVAGTEYPGAPTGWTPAAEPPGWRSGRRWPLSATTTAAAALVMALAVGITTWALTSKPAAQPGASPTTVPVIVSVPTIVILDGSGSMNQNDAPGPRIEAAKAAAAALIDALPADATIGLDTYGTSTGSSPAEHDIGCRDVTTLIPLGALDREAIHASITSLQASGYTPISLALHHAGTELPADNSPQAIVLVSDGEDTCDSDPCQTAAQLKTSHPNLTISTVGFKTDGPTAEQLRCIATTTGGLFVPATNAAQLSTRLIATQNLNAANTSLTPTGLGDIELGTTVTDIRATHPDFPNTTTTDTTTITWRDCDYTFTNNTLTTITPHNGGRTIDGLTPGTPLTTAIDLYGQPLATTPNNDNTTTVIFDADPNTDHAYRITINGTNTTNTSTITSITLCNCKPHEALLDAIYQAVKLQDPYLFEDDGTPLFNIIKVTEPQQGWYVAWIKRSDMELETARLALRENSPLNGHLTVETGPGTSFPPPSAPTPDPLPKAVRVELNGS